MIVGESVARTIEAKVFARLNAKDDGVTAGQRCCWPNMPRMGGILTRHGQQMRRKTAIPTSRCSLNSVPHVRRTREHARGVRREKNKPITRWI